MSDDELMSAAGRRPEAGSVGVVEPRRVRIPLPPEGLRLEKGGVLPELHVAYETYGALSPDRDNVIYICHALTGDAHAAGYHQVGEAKPGWWDAMVGPGKGLDTDRFHVVCANILGGCMGTTGPSSVNPRTGKPYGSAFPAITTADIVRVQRLLLEHLGIRRLAAVIGGSFGGMQVLEWSIRHADMVDRAICIASAMSLSAQALAFDIVGRHAILADPAWAGGDYYENRKVPAHGLAQARMIGHITYLSSEIMKRKFGREKKALDQPAQRFTTPFQVESYLDYQGAKFVNRFDANSYLHITEAMDHFDLTETHARPEDAFRTPGARTRFLVVALSSDWLFPPSQSLDITAALIRAGRRVTYCLLQSPYGHDAFLVEVDRLAEVVRTFLASPDSPAVEEADVPRRAGPVRRSGAATRPEADFDRIASMIRPGSRVLDLGCGDGELLARLMRSRQAQGLGMDIDLDNLLQAAARGLDVIQQDLDAGLEMIPDQSYDVAVLSETLQVVRKPRLVLNEMLRVAREGLVAIPNLGNWYHRLRLGLTGRMPMSPSLPFEWYDTPNIHLATLKDFERLCRKDGIRIRERVCIPAGRVSRALLGLGLPNLGADRVLLRLSR
jgi:homoserine O-acetyltransferase